MSHTNTSIQLKRGANTPDELATQELLFGEPFFIDNTQHDTNGFLTEPCNAYLYLGRKQGEETDVVTLEKSPVLKALSKEKADKLVFYNPANGSIINESNNELPVSRITANPVTSSDISTSNNTKYYILCQPDNDNTVYKFTLDELGIFINGNGIMHGAAWNDYAEYRLSNKPIEPGYVVCDLGEGFVDLSDVRLQPCAHVVSDTFGHIIGKEEDSVPIAVAGRVLVYVDNIDDITLGDCVCAGPKGIASKMTRQEIINYPDRILGIVCDIPKDSNRIWINIK